MPYRETTARERRIAAEAIGRGLPSRVAAGRAGCAPASAIRWGRAAGHHVPSPAEARLATAWPLERQRRALEAGRLYDRLRSTRAVADAMKLNRRTVMALLRSEHNPYPYPSTFLAA